jgi:hypothetical protein
MKYHKIPNVDKSVCTAEQMIAYNIAFRLHISYADEFQKINFVNRGGARAYCANLAREGLKEYRMSYSYKPGRYDEDAIFSALLAGLYNYLSDFHIFSNYEDIGRAFPAHYLKEE